VRQPIIEVITSAAQNPRRLSITVFALFFSWLLAFPFEGQILYSLANYHGISVAPLVFGAMIAHLFGLLAAGFVVMNLQGAKRLMIFAIAFSMVASGVFLFAPSFLWFAALLSSAFLMGCSVAAWGFYFKHGTPKEQRIKTIADALIAANILMILLNLSALYVAPHFGLGMAMLVLLAAFLFARLLPNSETSESFSPEGKGELPRSALGPLAFLCLFIVLITINSGLMYHVQGPSFADLEWLTSWYWALPYIAALLVLRNLPRRMSRAYSLYVAIAMVGFSFIFFLLLGRSWVDYLVVNTLMMGACGVFDLFWGSTLGEMLELGSNPAKIMGLGLAANVSGVLLGGFIGEAILGSGGGTQSQSATLLALGVVCLSLVFLPPLHNRLSSLLVNHAFLTGLAAMPAQEQDRLVLESRLWKLLTEREKEISALLLRGNTYRMVAGELHVSENTVKTHVKNIYSKIGVKSRAELMSLFIDTKSAAK